MESKFARQLGTWRVDKTPSESSDLILESTDSIPVDIGLRLEASDSIVEGVG